MSGLDKLYAYMAEPPGPGVYQRIIICVLVALFVCAVMYTMAMAKHRTSVVALGAWLASVVLVLVVGCTGVTVFASSFSKDAREASIAMNDAIDNGEAVKAIKSVQNGTRVVMEQADEIKEITGVDTREILNTVTRLPETKRSDETDWIIN